MDWNSVLLVLVTFVSFIVRVSSEGQNHTTLQWAYIVDSKQGNYTLVKYCVTVIPTDKPKWSFEIWWHCDSPSLVHPSLPRSSVSPSFIRLSLWSHLSLGYGWVPIALLATDFSPHSNPWKDHFWMRGTPAPLQPVPSLCLFNSFRFLERKSQQGFYRLCLICGWPHASPEAMTHIVYREKKKGKG